MKDNKYKSIDEEFDKKWTSCNCEGGWDYGQCSCDDIHSGHKFASKDIKSFLHTQISLSEQSLLKRVEKEIDKLETEYTTKAVQFGHENAFIFDIFEDIKNFLTSLKHLPLEEYK
jgi:hypothetical protein